VRRGAIRRVRGGGVAGPVPSERRRTRRTQMEPSRPGMAHACRVVAATPPPRTRRIAKRDVRGTLSGRVRRAEDDVAADERQNGRDVFDALFRAGKDVVGEHDEIGVLAGLERAERAFLV
jgi:hypothetical protein